MTDIRSAHFVGIGGVGMSWLAQLLLAEGWHVSGSDQADSPLLRKIEAAGATICPLGHRAENVPPGTGLVVYTAAAREDNPELVAARAAGIRTLKRSAFLGEVMAGKRGIAIAGTHGKTTTTAITGIALTEGGLDPTVMVGGEVPEFGSTLRLGSSDLLVVEADEYDATFLQLQPQIAVVTNIEPEHLDFYGTFEKAVATFARFLGSVPADGHVVACLDDPVLQGLQSAEVLAVYPKLTPNGAPGAALSPSVLQTPSLITYGYHPAAEWRAEQVEPNGKGGLSFTALHHGAEAGRFALSVPGRHNVSNTLAALATSHLLGLDITTLAPAVEAFKGVARRFQIIAEAGDVVVIDDYGHHPTEVRATLAAARLRYPGRRIRCVFQPHTYSRTKLLLPEFVDAFSDADEVATTDIYAAREEPVWDITGEQFASALNHQRATFTPTLTAATEWALADLRPGDVVLAMGAGDIYKVGAGVAEAVRAKYGA